MISVTVEGDNAIVVDLQDMPPKVQRAMVRAANRGISSARTFMVQSIAEDTGLKSGVVREKLPVREATWSRPEARLSASLKRIGLIDFGAKGQEPSRGRGRGVTYKLQGGGRGRLEHAFIATMKSGHRGVFMRKAGEYMVGRGPGKGSREKIQEKFGPSLGHVFAKYRAASLARALEMFQKNFAHEVIFSSGASGVQAASNTTIGADA